VLMTLAEYARHRGCHKKAVQFAIQRGRIKRNEDGSIESNEADADWENNTDHARARYGTKSPSSQTILSTHARRDPSIDIAAGMSRRKQSGEPDGNSSDYFKARAINAVYEARLKRIAFEEKQGSVLPKQDVERATFDCFRVLRDAILNVPCRISGQLADESDPLRIHELLEAEIRLALEAFVGVRGPVDVSGIGNEKRE
jgi:hypothetical protein